MSMNNFSELSADATAATFPQRCNKLWLLEAVPNRRPGLDIGFRTAPVQR
jgi:hypothetical protein